MALSDRSADLCRKLWLHVVSLCSGADATEWGRDSTVVRNDWEPPRRIDNQRRADGRHDKGTNLRRRQCGSRLLFFFCHQERGAGHETEGRSYDDILVARRDCESARKNKEDPTLEACWRNNSLAASDQTAALVPVPAPMAMPPQCLTRDRRPRTRMRARLCS
jgi:hypothetical protein